MSPSAKIEFANVIFKLLGHSSGPKGLITFTFLETFDLKAAENTTEVTNEKEDLEEDFLATITEVKETTWLVNLDSLGNFKAFFLAENALTDKKNRLMDLNSIKVMGLPLEGIQILEGKLKNVLETPFYKKIGFELEIELNQVRVVLADEKLGSLFDELHQQGMVLNRIEKGNTITLPSTIMHKKEKKERKLLLQKTENGAKLYLMLDASLSQPILDYLAEGKSPNSLKIKEFVTTTISKFFSAALHQLMDQGYKIPHYEFLPAT